MDLHELIRAATDRDLHILNIIIRQGGEITAEYHFAPEQRVLLWSASKTFTAMAVGIAQGEGYFNIEEPIANHFRVPAEPLWQKVAIRDLLRMGTGQRKCAITQALNRGQVLDDVEGLFFAEPVADEPGTHFMYNNAATYMLSKLISLRTGMCLNDYLRPRVFEPLSIRDVEWTADVNGVNFGASGLHLDAHELSRFGQLLLDGGQWRGAQLIPADYVREATAKQIDNADFSEPFATADHHAGYGYQLWMNSLPGSYRLDGLYGQYAVVIPEKDAVVTFISNEPKNMVGILELTWEFVVGQL